MRKIYLLSVFLLFISFGVSSKEISKDVAVKKALEVLQRNETNSQLIDAGSQLVKVEGVPAYYVLNFSPEGWALISAQDVVKPVIGYSNTGKYEIRNQPDFMKDWFRGIEKEIVETTNSNSRTYPGWDTGAENQVWKIRKAVAYDRVEPLVAVNWNQGKPFNAYCPSNANGTALVGCVAVAMAQAVSVAKFPARPNSSFSYFHNIYGTISINYDNEALYDWAAIISGSNNKSEVARLLYHCGVSVSMDYGVSGSGTMSSYVVAALKRNFSYASSVKIYTRNTYAGNWEELLLNELHAGRPVVYSGNNGGVGHAFNLDGFDGNNMYHVNWGWGGANNGYYTIDGMKDGDQIYTSNQQMIVGIRPPSQGPSDITLSNMSIPENMAVGTLVSDVIVDSEAKDPKYTYELKGNYNIFIHDYMPANFYIDENNKLRTKAVFNFNDGDETVIIKATNTSNNLSYEREFIIKVTENKTGVQNKKIDGLEIYKNGNNTLTINSPDDFNYSIFSVTGQIVLNGKIYKGDNSISLNKGMYIVNISGQNQFFSQKIVF